MQIFNAARFNATRFKTVAVLTAALSFTAPAVPAEASAAGSTAVNTFTYTVGGAAVKVPTGCFFTHIIKGSGKRIEYQNAGVDCGFVAALGPGFCNWRIDFTYVDTNNRTYKTSRGKTHPECKIDPMRNNSPQTLPRYGKSCTHLYVNGVRRSSQCHYIKK
ncbi:hypothetical protein ACIP93_22135 [Streptomyces sp. NPDC088745]|uniref:hypothetical protein n=1 Tax=Streptomyces sp. NPDC088745 TaxID=3365884 RepID=UPI0037FB3D31